MFTLRKSLGLQLEPEGRWTRAVFVGLFALIAVYAVALGTLPAQGAATVWFAVAHLLIEAAACALAVLRVALVPRERMAWTWLAIGLAVLVVGDAVRFIDAFSAASAWLAVVTNIAFFGALFACLGRIMRGRFSQISLSTWLDGLVSAFGLLTVVAFVATLNDVAQRITPLGVAYLFPPLLYVSMLVAILSSLNRRPSAVWWLSLTAALLLFGADAAHTPSVSEGATPVVTVLDAMWPAAAVLLVLVSWFAPASLPDDPSRVRIVVYVPAIFTFVGLVILVANEVIGGEDLTEYVAFATLAAGIIRLLLSVNEAERLRSRERSLSANLARARDKAVSAAAAKSSFLATMSHEMRTPLNAFIGMNELLLATDLDRVQRDYAERAAASGALLLDLITDILDFSKIEARAIDLAPTAFNLKQLVSSTVTILSFAAESKGVRITYEYDPALPSHVVGDSQRLRQVLVNLLGNAVKFTSAGEVKVRVARGTFENAVRFDVIDTGIGIPAEALDRIFEPFTQADASTTRTHGGTGLGLTICTALIGMMGGRIQVISEVGAGSTFWFEIALPATQPAPQTAWPITAASAQEDAHPDASGSGVLRVLVAEDNSTLRLLSAQVLSKLGHHTTVVANGKQALEAVHRESFDVVLMDVHMPEMDGLEASRRIRAAGDGISQPRIIAITAGVTTQDRDDCLAAGMDGFVTKPFTPRDLRAAFDSLETDGPAPASAAPATNDLSALDDLGAKNKADVLRTFLVSSAEDVQQLSDAVSRRDGARAVAVSHRLRGASLAIGAHRLAEACSRLELSPPEDVLDLDRLAEIVDAHEQAVREIERELGASPPG